MILLSRPNAVPVAVLIVLPVGGSLQAHFTDDDTTRDITAIAADLLVKYLLRGVGRVADDSGGNTDNVHVATISLSGGDMNEVRLATIDTRRGTIGEVPGHRFGPLLSAAIAMAVEDEIADLITDAENIANET